MPRKKQKFIDKKKAVSFRLVHRSQHDPLAADDEAGQHVLVPLDEAPVGDATERRRNEQIKFGVYYDDDYDYMQHLRTVDEYRNVHLAGDIRVPGEAALLPEDEDDDPEGVRLFRKTPRGLVPIVLEDEEKGKLRPSTTTSTTLTSPVGLLRLPASVFASADESKVGLVHRGAETSSRSGPILDWDPDVVAALDDDFDIDDPDNALDDDFVLQANQEGDEDSETEDWTDVDVNDDNDVDVEGIRSRLGRASLETGSSASQLTSGSEVGDFKARVEEIKREMALMAMKRMDDDDADYDHFDLEETKSRFTEYSMTSSVIRRNDQLTLLDDRFEKLYEQYDDDQIGGLDGEDIGGPVAARSEREDGAADANFGQILRDFERQNVKLAPQEVLEKLRDMEASAVDEPTEADLEEFVNVVCRERTDNNNWDCESILSTYSNLYNHPKRIVEEESKSNRKKKGGGDGRIELSRKSGLPLGVLPEVGPTRKQLESADYQGLTRLRTAPTMRPEDETREERRERKRAVKEERRERRMERKANTAAFKEEEKRQKKNLIDLTKNVQGFKIQ